MAAKFKRQTIRPNRSKDFFQNRHFMFKKCWNSLNSFLLRYSQNRMTDFCHFWLKSKLEAFSWRGGGGLESTLFFFIAVTPSAF